MYVMTNLGAIEKLCNEIMNSVYFRKQTPAELKQLRVVLDKVSMLVNDNVPPLIAEVKQLRNQNRRLSAEVEELGHREVPVASIASTAVGSSSE